jgi:2-polyprenyl-3-methyl-5-hydroxy-6-metoxy-1,4-benzoquinol methylase
MSTALWYNRWTFEKCKSKIHGNILEIGCGIGTFTEALIPYGNVYAIDRNSKNLAVARSRWKQKATFAVGNIETGHIPFPLPFYNTIICMNVLEHIKDDTKALIHMVRLLKTNGTLILLVPIHPFLYGTIDRAIGHFRRYHEYTIMRLVHINGLNVITKRRINCIGAIGWFFSSRVLRRPHVNSRSILFFNAVAPFFLSLEDMHEPPFGTSLLVIAKKVKK